MPALRGVSHARDNRIDRRGFHDFDDFGGVTVIFISGLVLAMLLGLAAKGLGYGTDGVIWGVFIGQGIAIVVGTVLAEQKGGVQW